MAATLNALEKILARSHTLIHRFWNITGAVARPVGISLRGIRVNLGQFKCHQVATTFAHEIVKKIEEIPGLLKTVAPVKAWLPCYAGLTYPTRRLYTLTGYVESWAAYRSRC